MKIMRRKKRHEAFTLSRNSHVLVSNPKTLSDFRLKNAGNSQTTFSELSHSLSAALSSIHTGSG